MNYRGQLEEVGNDTIRRWYDPSFVYNGVQNPWGDGVAFPDNWVTIAGGLTATAVGRGLMPDGLPYVEFTVTGTSNGNAQVLRCLTGVPMAMPALPGDVVSGAIGIQVFSNTGVTIHRWIGSLNSVGSVINSNGLQGPAITPESGYVYEVRDSATLNNAGTAGATVGVRINIPGGNGTVVDARFRVVFPVLSYGSVSSVTFAGSAQAVASRVNGIPQYGLMGYVLEEGYTNSVVGGRKLDTLSVTSMNVLADAALAVTGAYEATRFTDVLGGAGQHFVTTGPLAYVTGETVCISVFAKAGTRSAMQMLISNTVSSNNSWANFDLANGTLGTLGGAGMAIIEPYPNGWYRCSLIATITADGNAPVNLFAIPAPVSGRAPSFVGTGDTFYLHGFQITRSEDVVTPIMEPLGAPAVSIRARDDFSASLSTFTDLQTGSIAVRATRMRGMARSTNKFGPFFGGGINNAALFYWPASNVLPRLQINSGGVTQASRQATIGAPGSFNTGAMSWGGGSALLSFDGEAAVLDASAASPAAYTTAQVNGTSATANGTDNFILRYLRIWNNVALSAGAVQRESAKTS
jgi:hypothetical protein